MRRHWFEPTGDHLVADDQSVLPPSDIRAETAPARIAPLAPWFFQPPEEVAAEIGDFDCGYVVVPEAHDDPDSPDVRLGFVRLPARGGASGAPLFMLSGDPGSTLLAPITFSLFSADFLGPRREGRDIVILEERGSFQSIPALDCPLLHRVPWLANRFGLDRDAAASLTREVFADCVAQAKAHGIDLSRYNSLATAADIDKARRAMGYDRIVYYGASYGAQLGQHLMRDYPDTLEAAILDGASALSVKSWVQDRAINVEDGVELFVATCEADAKCGEAYDFRALLDQAMALLGEGPVAARYTDPDDPATAVDLTIGEEEFAMAVFEMQTGQILIRSLPAMLHLAVADGRASMAEVLGQILGEKIVAARDATRGGIATLMHARWSVRTIR